MHKPRLTGQTWRDWLPGAEWQARLQVGTRRRARPRQERTPLPALAFLGVASKGRAVPPLHRALRLRPRATIRGEKCGRLERIRRNKRAVAMETGEPQPSS